MELADQLVQLTDNQDLAEWVKLLAMNVAYYEMKYEPLPLEEHMAMTYSNDLNDRQGNLVTKGMETMVGMLGSVIQELDDKVGH